MRLINGNVLVRIAKEPERTSNGVWVITNQPNKCGEGTVVETNTSQTIVKNSYVYFPAYSGTEVTIKNEVYRVVPEKDILLVIDETTDSL